MAKLLSIGQFNDLYKYTHGRICDNKELYSNTHKEYYGHRPDYYSTSDKSKDIYSKGMGISVQMPKSIKHDTVLWVNGEMQSVTHNILVGSNEHMDLVRESELYAKRIDRAYYYSRRIDGI